MNKKVGFDNSAEPLRKLRAVLDPSSAQSPASWPQEQGTDSGPSLALPADPPSLASRVTRQETAFWLKLECFLRIQTDWSLILELYFQSSPSLRSFITTFTDLIELLTKKL